MRAKAKVHSCQRPIFALQKIADHLTERHEFRKLGRLTEIPVRAESSHFLAVAARIRGRDNENKSVVAARTDAELAQYVPSFVPRHVDIEQDEIRARCCRVRVRLLEKLHRLLAVVGNVDLRVDARFLERATDQGNIGLVVLGDQNMPRPPRLGAVRGGA